MACNREKTQNHYTWSYRLLRERFPVRTQKTNALRASQGSGKWEASSSASWIVLVPKATAGSAAGSGLQHPCFSQEKLSVEGGG